VAGEADLLFDVGNALATRVSVLVETGTEDAESAGPLPKLSNPASEGKPPMKGHIRKRRSWEFVVDIGRDPVTGRRRQKSKSGFATKKEAESALHEFIQYIAGGGQPSPPRIALAAHLSRWIDYQRTRGIRPRTLYGYEGYIRPVIGGLEVAELRPSHVRAVLTRMQHRGLAAATIGQVRGILGSALRQP